MNDNLMESRKLSNRAMIQSYQQLFGQASKTTGTKLEITSHRLLIQAGYIRESVAGRYYLLPLGLRVHDKIQAIIREEMNRSGAQEVVAPILHQLELWQETQRDQSVGFELMQIKDRRGAGFALGGTAEEMFVDLVRKFNLSYKHLPLNLYQFGWKFRDEARARGGLLRLREFVMKDAYSFSTPQQFEAIYASMKATYQRIFDRLGLTTVVVAADGGYIGGEYCHEFVVDSPVGESVYLVGPDGEAVHQDLAVRDKSLGRSAAPKPLKKVPLKRGPTMADSLAAHAGSVLTDHLKTVVYANHQDEIIMACLRGDLAVNETKLARVTDAHQLTLLSDEQIAKRLASAAGWLSPVDLKADACRVVVDDSIVTGANFISGANQVGYDYQNVNRDRDFKADLEADIALAKGGDPAVGGGQLIESCGIEVGNIFQLGYHYSQAMKGATYTNAAGQPANYYMGCYGIGLARSLAAVAEVLSDSAGLIWPASIAPYQICLLGLDNLPEIIEQVGELERQFDRAGLEVLLDDRWELRAGAKLVTADLLGLPIIVIVSQRSLAQRQIELKIRSTGRTELLAPDHVTARVSQLVADLTIQPRPAVEQKNN